MTGPKPSGPTHPTPTHPPSKPTFTAHGPDPDPAPRPEQPDLPTTRFEAPARSWTSPAYVVRTGWYAAVGASR